MTDIDDPGRGSELQQRILQKSALRRLYEEIYARYAAVLNRCPEQGQAIELGAGAGFSRSAVPGLITADVLPYPTVDLVFDAGHMPFADGSLRFLGLLNTLHHLPDVPSFFAEAQRCLRPGGRMLIVDQYHGWLSRWIFRYLHHEPWDPNAADWRFDSTGPLSGANGALAWIVFVRDRTKFEALFPKLRVVSVRPHTPLRYWLSGGLKRWTLLPQPAWRLATAVDQLLLRCSPHWASFMDVELVRTE